MRVTFSSFPRSSGCPKSLLRPLQDNGGSVSKYSISISCWEAALIKIFKEPFIPEDQLLLLPPNVADFVAKDARVRIVSELADELDLRPLRGPFEGGGPP